MTEYPNAATEPEVDDSPLPAINWPDLDDAALQGVTGKIVRAVMPHTEADPAAVTVTLLSTFGSMAGPGVCALAGNDHHAARIWPLIVGRTADGAKGTSWSTVRPIIDAADPHFLAEHRVGGIVSGEGIIEQIADPVDEDDDNGTLDKRLLIVETEFASVLAKGARQGSSLMPTLREAWDGTTLRSLARKNNKLKATDPHITVVGHITPGEFKSKLTGGEVDGGSINRFLLVLSRRSKELPAGGNLPTDVRDACGALVAQAAEVARSRRGPMARTPEAGELWSRSYSGLIAPKPDGWFASTTARAHGHVLRLSVAYAALDASPVIEVDHLKAALALWNYCEESARVLFAEVGYESRRDDTMKVLDFIRSNGEVTRTQLIHDLFARHKKGHEVDAILKPLIDAGLVAQREVPTTGRPRTVYTLRQKRQSDKSPPTSGDTSTLLSLLSHSATKVPKGKPQAEGHKSLKSLNSPGGEPANLTPAAERTRKAAKAGGKFAADPPCFHCDKPVVSKHQDDAGRFMHHECQKSAEVSA
jgi:hypothetical protein